MELHLVEFEHLELAIVGIVCGKLVTKFGSGVQAGFRYHHAEPTYLVLTLWLPDRPCTLPPNASHQVGIGAFVLNDKNEVLMFLVCFLDWLLRMVLNKFFKARQSASWISFV